MSSFDNLALAYDSTIDWTARLNHELPFLFSLLDNPKQSRALDMACGSGHHSIALGAQGVEVIGFDSSETMIRAARRHGEEKNVNVQFIVGEMEKITDIAKGNFDLVICLGNSLALLRDIDDVKDVVKEIFNFLNEGGFFIVQILNFEEIHWTGFRTFPMKKGKLSDGKEVTFSRLFEHTDYPYSSTLVMSAFREVNGVWTSEVETQKVLNLNYESIKGIFKQVGFRNIEFYSDYNKTPLDRKYHRNIVVQAKK